MKKTLLLGIIGAVGLMATPVYAAQTVTNKGVTLSMDKNSYTIGEKAKVTAIIKDTASWELHIVGDENFGNCKLDESDVTSDAKNTNKQFTLECTVTKASTDARVKAYGTTTNEAVQEDEFAIETSVITSESSSTPSTPSDPSTPSTPTTTQAADAKEETVENPKTGIYDYLWALPIALLAAVGIVRVSKSNSMFKKC